MFHLNQKTKGILSVFAAFLTHFNIGSIYSAGLISPFLISYMHSFDENIKMEGGFWFFTCTFLTLSMSCILGVYLENKIGSRL